MDAGLIYMPGQKPFIGNRRPGFYSDKYGTQQKVIKESVTKPKMCIYTILTAICWREFCCHVIVMII